MKPKVRKNILNENKFEYFSNINVDNLKIKF